MAMTTLEPVETLERDAPRWKSPVRKLLRFFQSSRNRWKAKYLALKGECRLLGNQVRAVEKSREKWKRTARQSQQQLRQLQRAFAEQQKSAA